ncbi:cyclin N-terminal domain-containing protein 1-like isoform X2 [Tyto alba]|uniref:cyclin N-terminal domain-containing protein 1 isoform X2 n=1 Tax=Tyto alba TaxID=56313 RepID=UPI001C66CEC8|nr:cyclin N-terminal domain-containing protein 1 isoform X2 [Tyto alba]XP_042643371.1 cyclin N-terminal domain-containing protein 1-like isoform X2 [Tyto alba]
MGPQARAASRGRDSGPVFGGVAPEIIEDALIRLATENERHLSELPGRAGFFKETRIVEFIFLLSEKWHLDHSARYQAVELLERFMIKQVEQICKSSRGNHEQGQGSSWSSLSNQIYDTFVLRLVSCVQLASKVSLHYNIVNSDMALKFLQSLKYCYTKQELLESELAVLKTLHFQINVSTPLAYVELLLEVLGHNGCLLPAKPLHQMCMQLLDFSYLTRDTIYNTLLKIAIENSTPSKLQVAKFLTVKEDFMLLAVGIISTSVFVLNPEHWKQVVEHLNSITGITSQSILELSYAVLKHIIGSTTPKQHYRNCGTKAPENRILPLK